MKRFGQGKAADLFTLELDGKGHIADQIARARAKQAREELDSQRAAIRAGNVRAFPAVVREHRTLIAECPYTRTIFIGIVADKLACAFCGEAHDVREVSITRLRDCPPDKGEWVGVMWSEFEADGVRLRDD